MNKLKYIPFTIVILISTLLISCSISKHDKKTKKEESSDKYIGFTKATVNYLELDGCSWILQLDDGNKLQPLNLTPEFQKNNLKVWIKYSINKQGVGICMVGEMVTILEIKLR